MEKKSQKAQRTCEECLSWFLLTSFFFLHWFRSRRGEREKMGQRLHPISSLLTSWVSNTEQQVGKKLRLVFFKMPSFLRSFQTLCLQVKSVPHTNLHSQHLSLSVQDKISKKVCVCLCLDSTLPSCFGRIVVVCCVLATLAVNLLFCLTLTSHHYSPAWREFGGGF